LIAKQWSTEKDQDDQDEIHFGDIVFFNGCSSNV